MVRMSHLTLPLLPASLSIKAVVTVCGIEGIGFTIGAFAQALVQILCISTDTDIDATLHIRALLPAYELNPKDFAVSPLHEFTSDPAIKSIIFIHKSTLIITEYKKNNHMTK